MDIKIQTQQIVNAIRSIDESETFKQEKVSLMVNQNIETGNEYIVVFYKE